MREQSERITGAVIRSIEDFAHIAKIDQSFGTWSTRQVGDEDIFVDVPRAVTIDDGVFLGMQTAAVAGLIAIAAIREPAGVAVIPDGEYFTEIGAGDYRADFESLACSTTGQTFRKLKIDLFE